MALSTHETGVITTGELSPCGPGQTGTAPTREEVDGPAGERTLVSGFKQMKLEKEAQKNWDLFYKRNTTNFFKDRHWTCREFEELRACREVREDGHARAESRPQAVLTPGSGTTRHRKVTDIQSDHSCLRNLT